MAAGCWSKRLLVRGLQGTLTTLCASPLAPDTLSTVPSACRSTLDGSVPPTHWSSPSKKALLVFFLRACSGVTVTVALPKAWRASQLACCFCNCSVVAQPSGKRGGSAAAGSASALDDRPPCVAVRSRLCCASSSALGVSSARARSVMRAAQMAATTLLPSRRRAGWRTTRSNMLATGTLKVGERHVHEVPAKRIWMSVIL